MRAGWFAMDAPGHIRASDDDRERAATALRQHCAAGRLSTEELEQRLERAYAARTVGELAQLMRDLPELAADGTVRTPPTPAERHELALREQRGRLGRRAVRRGGQGLVVGAACVALWWVDGGRGLFWPAFVLLLVLVAVARSFWRLYGPHPDAAALERALTRSQRRERRRAALERRRQLWDQLESMLTAQLEQRQARARDHRSPRPPRV